MGANEDGKKFGLSFVVGFLAMLGAFYSCINIQREYNTSDFASQWAMVLVIVGIIAALVKLNKSS